MRETPCTVTAPAREAGHRLPVWATKIGGDSLCFCTLKEDCERRQSGRWFGICTANTVAGRAGGRATSARCAPWPGTGSRREQEGAGWWLLAGPVGAGVGGLLVGVLGEVWVGGRGRGRGRARSGGGRAPRQGGAARKKRESESGEIRGGRPRVLLLLLLLLLLLAVRAAARRE